MMTRYEQGFMDKCAEYGIKQADAQVLLKNYGPDAAVGALLGGVVGGVATKDRRKRLRNALLSALVGAGGGAAIRHGIAGKDIHLVNSTVDLAKDYNSLLDEKGISEKLIARLPLDQVRKRIPLKGIGEGRYPMTRERLQEGVDRLQEIISSARNKSENG